MENDNSSLKILIVGPQVMVDLVRPNLEKYGYNVVVGTEMSDPESVATLEKPDFCVAANLTDHKDYKCEDFLANFSKRFPKVPLSLVVCSGPTIESSDSYELNVERVKSYGVEQIHFFPFEKEQLLNEVFSKAVIDIPVQNLDLDAMMKVSLADVNQDEDFPFDVFLYLPLNKKLLLYRKAGMPIEDKLKKKADDPRFNLLVKRSDYQKYLGLVVGNLEKIAQSEDLTNAQRTQLLKQETKSLMQDFFLKKDLGQGEGQKIVDTFRDIATNFVGSVSDNKEAETQIKMLTAQILSQQTHVLNVSSYAALFGLVAGVDTSDIENLSLSGLLHDLGFYKLPMNFANKEEWELEGQELEEYRMHPLYSVDVIVEKKLPVSAKVQSIIQQHHERNDGSGYPHGIKGDSIDKLSKICALADVFDEMTSLKEGQKNLSPKEAFEEIAGLNGGKAHPCYDEEIHWPIIQDLIGCGAELNSKEAEVVTIESSGQNASPDLSDVIQTEVPPVEQGVVEKSDQIASVMSQLGEVDEDEDEVLFEAS